MTDTAAPAPAGGQGAAPAAAPVSAAATLAAPVTPPQAAAPAAASAAIEWLPGAAEDVASYVQNKGWKAPADLLTSYQQLEKHMGTPADKLLRIPDWDKADKTELEQVYTKLGRPADPKEYNLPVPEGQPREFADTASKWFHEAGLSARQAQAVTAKWNEFVASQQTASVEQYQANLQEQEKSLRKEWGAAFDQNIGAAKAAANALGLKAEQIDALEKSLGFDGLMKMMSSIGVKTGEDKFVSGADSQSFGAMTPAQAQSKIKTLQQDQEWVKKYLAGNAEAKAEMERLMKFAYPGG